MAFELRGSFRMILYLLECTRGPLSNDIAFLKILERRRVDAFTRRIDGRNKEWIGLIR